MDPCHGSPRFDLLNDCFRELLFAVLASGFTFAMTFTTLMPTGVKSRLRKITQPLRPSLSVQEALDHLVGPSAAETHDQEPVSTTPRLVLSGLSLSETLVWLAIASYRFILSRRETNLNLWSIPPLLLSLSWFYAAMRPLLGSPKALPYDLLILFSMHLIAATTSLGQIIYLYCAFGQPLPDIYALSFKLANLSIIALLLFVLLLLPLDQPDPRVDRGRIGTTQTPEDYTSLIKWLTFSWLNPILKKGRSKALEESDIWNLSPSMQSRAVFATFKETSDSPALTQLWSLVSVDLILDAILTLTSILLSYAGPFFLRRILGVVNSPKTHENANAFLFSILAFVCSVLKAIIDMQHLWFGRRASVRVRSCLMALIYEKALAHGIETRERGDDLRGSRRDKKVAKRERRKRRDEKVAKPAQTQPSGVSAVTTDFVMSLLTGDASKVSQMVSSGYLIYGALVEIGIAVVFLYDLLGLTAMAGFFVLLALSPLNYVLSKRGIRIAKRLVATRNTRVWSVNEALMEMKLIKLLAWHKSWLSRSFRFREMELKYLSKEKVNSAWFSLLWGTAPSLVSVIAFAAYVYTGNRLTVATAFTSLVLFNMIKGPLNIVPHALFQVADARRSLRRIVSFLSRPDKEPIAAIFSDEIAELNVRNGRFFWRSEDLGISQPEHDDTDPTLPFELRDISVSFPTGAVTVVTGPAASGKTALLKALLGEMVSAPGTILSVPTGTPMLSRGLSNSFSYAAQEIWLEHSTIQENITFGSPFDAERFRAVVECCALQLEVDAFKEGEVGSKHVTLSGAQKARISIARAVYARTQYVLLDDPLRELNPQAAEHLWTRILNSPVVKSRTIIIATRDARLLLPSTRYLIKMRNGQIDRQIMVTDLDDTAGAAAPPEPFDAAAADRPAGDEYVGDEIEDAIDPEAEIKEMKMRRSRGSWSTLTAYWTLCSKYLSTMSSSICVTAFLFGVAFQVASVMEKLWVQVWGSSYDEAPHPRVTNISLPPWLLHPSIGLPIPPLPPAHQDPLLYVAIYAGISIFAVAMNSSSFALYQIGAFRASKELFSRLLESLFAAPLRWHDHTRTGRFIHRLKKDTLALDSSLPSSLRVALGWVATHFACTLTIICVFPSFLLPAAIILAIYVFFGRTYLVIGRDLRRLENMTRASAFASFASSLRGIDTIRTFGGKPRALKSFHERLDQTTKMWYYFWMLNRWLLLRFDILGAVTVFITMISSAAGYVPGNRAGLVITSAMACANSAYWACRYLALLGLDLKSLSRIFEFYDIPQEADSQEQPPAYWPSLPSPHKRLAEFIKIEDLTVSPLQDNPPALRGVTFSIKAREKVAFLGRMNSGKSALAMSFLRFPEPDNGSITIDGVNINEIGLEPLRRKITVVPQDAAILSGTIRDNLDPFNQYSDEECLDALLRVRMMDLSQIISDEDAPADPSSDTINLDSSLSNGELRLTQGQRQLLALARALLRQSPIVIIDEATNSIDIKSDAKLQATIREEMRDVCVIMVAHRVKSIIDFDRLIILDEGRVAQIGSPYQLIQREGVFRDMCLKLGKETFEQLRDGARRKVGRHSTIWL